MSYTASDIQKILSNAAKFIARLYISNKSGKLVRLIPNDEQTQVIEALETGKNVLVVKPRQIGSTTIVAAYLFWKAYTSKEPITIALLSHKLDSVKHILKMFRTFYKNLPEFLRQPLKEDSASKIVFHNGATILCASSSSKGGMRSFTCNYLLLSEFAFAEDAEELKATAVAAVNNGQIIIESTANYFGDPLHLEIETAQRGEAGYTWLMFPWHQHREYSLPAKDLIPTPEETNLIERYSLTLEQVQWRRVQIQKIGPDKFKREYPACLADAYSQGGDAYLTEDDLSNITSLELGNEQWIPIQAPTHNDQYSIGVDVGSGTGRDYSVAMVLSKMTNQIVGIFRSNTTTPTELAQELFTLAAQYNNAKILVENNNVGVVVNQALTGSNLWKGTDDKYWTTSQTNKRVAFEELKEAIRSGTIYQLDTITLGELRSIKLDKQYNISLERANGAHADSAVALALAWQCLKIVRLSQREHLPQWVKTQRASKIVGIANGNATRRY